MDSRAEEELLKNFHSFRSFGRPVKNFEYETEKFFTGHQRRKTLVKLGRKCSSTAGQLLQGHFLSHTRHLGLLVGGREGGGGGVITGPSRQGKGWCIELLSPTRYSYQLRMGGVKAAENTGW